MTVLIPAAPGPVPPLRPSSSVAGVGEAVRRTASLLDQVSEWATHGGQPAGWDGDASRAADHAMTRLTRDVDDAVAVLQQAGTAIITFADRVEGLRMRRDGLVSDRTSLMSRHADLVEDAASGTVDEAVLRDDARRLAGDIDAHASDVTRWQSDVTVAEDTLIAVLRSSDTATEARFLAASRSASVDDLIRSLSDQGILPPNAASMSVEELRSWLIDHPEAAEALLAQRPLPGSDGPAGELGSLLTPMLVPEGGAAEAEAGRRDAIRALFEGLSEEDAGRLALLFPGVVGNRPGVPFDHRADANTVAIVDALARERTEIDRLRDSYDWRDSVVSGDPSYELIKLQIRQGEERLAAFESLLSGDRQIVYFDPSGDGAIAELHGQIGPDTQNLGVHVPGTGTDLASFQGVADRSESFVNNARGSLAMISWMGGDLPDGLLLDAPTPGYAQDLAPVLAGFSQEVRQELEHEAPAGVRTTYLGHSYGGAVVGLSETYGLQADRVLHVESAGMGHDVRSTSDLPDSQDGVDRYSMTAPGDIIGHVQGSQVGDLGHGADPDDWPGTLRIDTGDTADGTPNTGPDSHSRVFQARSDAWRNMYEVLTGGEVMPYREPIYETIVTDRSAVRIQTGWAPANRVDIQ
ncbi:hypothetical protein GCM10027425_25080 [Alteromonas gracilis]